MAHFNTPGGRPPRAACREVKGSLLFSGWSRWVSDSLTSTPWAGRPYPRLHRWQLWRPQGLEGWREARPGLEWPRACRSRVWGYQGACPLHASPLACAFKCFFFLELPTLPDYLAWWGDQCCPESKPSPVLNPGIGVVFSERWSDLVHLAAWGRFRGLDTSLHNSKVCASSCLAPPASFLQFCGFYSKSS